MTSFSKIVDDLITKAHDNVSPYLFVLIVAGFAVARSVFPDDDRFSYFLIPATLIEIILVLARLVQFLVVKHWIQDCWKMYKNFIRNCLMRLLRSPEL
jgi:hypothetical protein